MGDVRTRRLSPSLVISLLALFFALGGSAFAVQQAVKPQPYCKQGAVRGIAYVTGDPTKGLQNVSQDFTNAPGLFGYRWNCSGGPISIRRVGNTAIDVRFAGNPSSVAFANVYSTEGGAAAVTRNQDGSFRVVVRGVGNDSEGHPVDFVSRQNLQFEIVLF